MNIELYSHQAIGENCSDHLGPRNWWCSKLSISFVNAPSAEGLKIMPLENFPYFQAYKKYRPLISNNGCQCDGFTFEVNTEYQSSLCFLVA